MHSIITQLLVEQELRQQRSSARRGAAAHRPSHIDTTAHEARRALVIASLLHIPPKPERLDAGVPGEGR